MTNMSKKATDRNADRFFTFFGFLWQNEPADMAGRHVDN